MTCLTVPSASFQKNPSCLGSVNQGVYFLFFLIFFFFMEMIVLFCMWGYMLVAKHFVFLVLRKFRFELGLEEVWKQLWVRRPQLGQEFVWKRITMSSNTYQLEFAKPESFICLQVSNENQSWNSISTVTTQQASWQSENNKHLHGCFIGL